MSVSSCAIILADRMGGALLCTNWFDQCIWHLAYACGGTTEPGSEASVFCVQESLDEVLVPQKLIFQDQSWDLGQGADNRVILKQIADILRSDQSLVLQLSGKQQSASPVHEDVDQYKDAVTEKTFTECYPTETFPENKALTLSTACALSVKKVLTVTYGGMLLA